VHDSQQENTRAPGARPPKLAPTSVPGVYRRDGAQGTTYVATWRANGRQCRKSFRTLALAREWKGRTAHEVTPAPSRLKFAAHAPAWLASYRGRTRAGFSESTRRRYDQLLRLHAIPYLGHERLSAIDRPRVKAWLADLERAGASANTIAKVIAPVRALFADAVDDGLMQVNPLAGLHYAPRAAATGGEREVRALTSDELAVLIECTRPDRRLLIEFLAATGLRISEAIGLRWEHITFDGDGAVVAVRVQRYQGTEKALKTANGRRDVPLSGELANALLATRPDDPRLHELPVFAARTGQPLDYSNLYQRVLAPARRKAALEWVGFHSLRHTCASMLIAQGRSPIVVSRWLGHARPSFTLDVYGHLSDGGLGDALDVRPPALPSPAPGEALTTG
jgi:integrase